MSKQSREDFIREYVLNRAGTDSSDGYHDAVVAGKIYDSHLSTKKKQKESVENKSKPQLLNE